MLDRKTFFAQIRSKLFAGFMHQDQVDGIGKILDEWEHRGLSDLRWLAYMLATVFHETAEKMIPVREMGSEAYLRSKPYFPWVGEGLVQVTWEANARKFGAVRPGDCMSWPVALRALFDGMLQGMFAKDARGPQSLSRYFNPSVSDPLGARRIINGTDRASLIDGYFNAFYAALLAASAPVTRAGTLPGSVLVDGTLSTQPRPVVIPRPVAPPHLPPSAPPKQTWGDWFKSAFFARKA